MIEHSDGGQVGVNNDQVNVHRVSLPDVTLGFERELTERILSPGAPWSHDVFSHDARPDIGGSGHIGFGSSSGSMLSGPAGNTLVIVRDSRGITVGNHGFQRNEFRIRVRAVKVSATELDRNSTRSRAIARLHADPGGRAAAQSPADDIAGAAATGLELRYEAEDRAAGEIHPRCRRACRRGG